MKNILFILLFSFSISLAFAQQPIHYGSNKGKYISIYDTKIYYEEYGKGIPLLLLQGGTGSISDFKEVIPDLAKRFRVIAVDSPGQGRSEHSDSLSYSLLAGYFSKFIDLMKMDSIYIIGWSDGGVAALLMAAERPEKIKRIIVSGAQFGISGYTLDSQQAVSSMSPETVEKYWDSWVSDYKSKAPAGNDWKKLITDLRKMWSTPVFVPDEKVRKIKSRTLIVLGDRDAITLQHGIEMYQAIKGSEFLVLPNTTHSVFTEQPDILNRIAIGFLTKK